MRCLSCGILLNVECPNPMCQKQHGQAMEKAKQCDWCAQRKAETVTLLSSALLQYIALDDLLKQDTVLEDAPTFEA